jgi:hypothetical protein
MPTGLGHIMFISLLATVLSMTPFGHNRGRGRHPGFGGTVHLQAAPLICCRS